MIQNNKDKQSLYNRLDNIVAIVQKPYHNIIKRKIYTNVLYPKKDYIKPKDHPLNLIENI